MVATGDGIIVDFDSVEDAVACAAGMQRLLAQHRKDHGFAPQVRIGIHRSDAQQVGQSYRGSASTKRQSSPLRRRAARS